MLDVCAVFFTRVIQDCVTQVTALVRPSWDEWCRQVVVPRIENAENAEPSRDRHCFLKHGLSAEECVRINWYVNEHLNEANNLKNRVLASIADLPDVEARVREEFCKGRGALDNPHGVGVYADIRQLEKALLAPANRSVSAEQWYCNCMRDISIALGTLYIETRSSCQAATLSDFCSLAGITPENLTTIYEGKAFPRYEWEPASDDTPSSRADRIFNGFVLGDPFMGDVPEIIFRRPCSRGSLTFQNLSSRFQARENTQGAHGRVTVADASSQVRALASLCVLLVKAACYAHALLTLKPAHKDSPCVLRPCLGELIQEVDAGTAATWDLDWLSHPSELECRVKDGSFKVLVERVLLLEWLVFKKVSSRNIYDAARVWCDGFGDALGWTDAEGELSVNTIHRQTLLGNKAFHNFIQGVDFGKWPSVPMEAVPRHNGLDEVVDFLDHVTNAAQQRVLALLPEREGEFRGDVPAHLELGWLLRPTELPSSPRQDEDLHLGHGWCISYPHGAEEVQRCVDRRRSAHELSQPLATVGASRAKASAFLLLHALGSKSWFHLLLNKTDLLRQVTEGSIVDVGLESLQFPPTVRVEEIWKKAMYSAQRLHMDEGGNGRLVLAATIAREAVHHVGAHNQGNGRFLPSEEAHSYVRFLYRNTLPGLVFQQHGIPLTGAILRQMQTANFFRLPWQQPRTSQWILVPENWDIGEMVHVISGDLEGKGPLTLTQAPRLRNTATGFSKVLRTKKFVM